jgi:hypothetical protein
MPNSQVTRIQLNKDDSITLEIKVYGFDEGTPIEVFGQATQDNGAVAAFYTAQPMPAPDADENALITLDSVKVSSQKFAVGFPITVGARAAVAWTTNLVNDAGDPPPRIGTGVFEAAWKANQAKPTTVALVRPRAEEPGADGELRHGKWWDRVKSEPLNAVMGGRFTRLFPDLIGASFAQTDLELLATAMTVQREEPEQEPDPEENPGVPAAYTYLGQFVDHDLTFDPISHLRETLSPAQLKALVDFRTPRFDLDNLYGRGPDDQPYMYRKDGIHLLPGKHLSGTPFDPRAVDLPRGPSGRALIGDPRNDENRIVAQLHAIFLRFHNRIVHKLREENKHVSFQEVRDQVRWHYQWVLVTDFLPKILDKETYKSVFPDRFRYVTTIPRLRENDLELMPVEFSVAAYRFGHSMIRPQYQLNRDIGPIPIFFGHPDDPTADLGGLRPIPAGWAIDWRFFIDLGHDGGPVAGGPRPDQLQFSYKIDTSLVHPLRNLPHRIAKDPSSLALRNLERGATFQLPSGQQVARTLGVEPLADAELLIGKAIVQNPKPPSIIDICPRFARNAPLWAYILSEAQVMSWKNLAAGPPTDKTPIRLGPVGGRLVAEVFASLLRGDHTSYLYAEPRFKPIPDFTRNGRFGLAQLINVALGRSP